MDSSPEADQSRSYHPIQPPKICSYVAHWPICSSPSDLSPTGFHFRILQPFSFSFTCPACLIILDLIIPIKRLLCEDFLIMQLAPTCWDWFSFWPKFLTQDPVIILLYYKKTCFTLILKKQYSGLSPRANYTDRATVACRRSDCQLLRIEGATWSAWRIPTAVFSVF
jgi:hypothetical protein